MTPCSGLHGAAAYALVGTLAFGEAAAFVGLVLPGELAVLLGGVLASEGRVSLPVMVAVAVSAAVLGDSVGYEVGRHAGARLLARPAFARRFGRHVRRAEAYLAERGGRAVFVGRWTTVLRALVLGVAGMAGMPYGRFLAFNLLGGVAWGATFVLLGYLAGASYRTVEAVAGEASLLLVVLLGLAVAAQRLLRRVAARPERARALADRLLAGAPARWAAGRWGPQLRWLSRRLDPRLRTGLGTTVTLGLLAAAGWVLGVSVQDLLAGEELALLDGAVHRWVLARRTPAAVAVARAVLGVVEVPWLVATAAVLALLAWRAARWPAGLRLLGGAALTVVVGGALRRVLPITAAGTRFPSVEAAAATALATSLVAAISRRGWRAATRAASVAAIAVVVVGMAALVDAASTLTGVVGGTGLGSLVALLLEVPSRLPPSDAADASRRAGVQVRGAGR